MSEFTVSPARQPLKGRLGIPADKSISHRAAILSALAEGDTRIENYLDSETTHATLNCLRAMGVDIEEVAPETLVVHGRGLHPAARARRCVVLPWLWHDDALARWTVRRASVFCRSSMARPHSSAARWRVWSSRCARWERRSWRATMGDCRRWRFAAVICTAWTPHSRSPARRSNRPCCWQACSPARPHDGARAWPQPRPHRAHVARVRRRRRTVGRPPPTGRARLSALRSPTLRRV